MENCHCSTPCHVTKYQAKVSSMPLPQKAYTALHKELQTGTVDTIK
jgi:hypothetical protein